MDFVHVSIYYKTNKERKHLLETTYIYIGGSWLQHFFYHSPNVNFKRINSNVNNKYTFHLEKGKWKRKNDEWLDRIHTNPNLALFLVSHWFIVAQQQVRKTFLNIPSFCVKKNYNHARFCSFHNVKAGGAFCQGFSPLSCSNYYSLTSRDVIAYRALCPSIEKQVRTHRPICEFCNFVNGEVAKMNISKVLKDGCTNSLPHLKECERTISSCNL